MRYIELDELDEEIKKVDERAKISDDELRRALSEFCLRIDYTLPDDPLSEEYYNAQMNLYSAISGRKQYSVKNEYTEFNFEDGLRNPFPYCTESSTTVGNHLMGIGFLIRTMALPPRSNIIEFGAGYGETTYHLAMMGYNVTVVDIGKNFLDVIAARLENNSRKAKLVQEDMLEYRSSSKYDAVLFYEAFHHCSKPFSFLEGVSDMMKDTGIICFAAEPIVKGFTGPLPYPWGVRLDGISIWSMRKFGWLELGFEQSFFLKALDNCGFSAEVHADSLCPYSNIIIAKKRNGSHPQGEIRILGPSERPHTPKKAANTAKQNSKTGVIKQTQNIIKKFLANCLGYSIRENGCWYAIEVWDEVPTRWISNDAPLSIYSEKNGFIDLTFRALSFYQPRTLEIYCDDRLQNQLTIPTNFVNVSTRIPLQKGENLILMHVPDGAERPCDIPELNNRDTRCLSIAIQNISLQS